MTRPWKNPDKMSRLELVKEVKQLRRDMRVTRRFAQEALDGWREGNDIVSPMRRLHEHLAGSS